MEFICTRTGSRNLTAPNASMSERRIVVLNCNRPHIQRNVVCDDTMQKRCSTLQPGTLIRTDTSHTSHQPQLSVWVYHLESFELKEKIPVRSLEIFSFFFQSLHQQRISIYLYISSAYSNIMKWKKTDFPEEYAEEMKCCSFNLEDFILFSFQFSLLLCSFIFLLLIPNCSLAVLRCSARWWKLTSDVNAATISNKNEKLFTIFISTIETQVDTREKECVQRFKHTQHTCTQPL